MSQRLRDLMAMSRFANLPTVWSNVLVGAMLAYPLGPTFWQQWALLSLTISALYLGGCFLNDWHDVHFDRQHRPERPIPDGRWDRKTIGILSGILLFVGTGNLFFWSITAGAFGLGILGCVLIYTRWHKTQPFSLLFMAGARMFIYPASFFALVSSSEIPQQLVLLLTMAAGFMGSYILGISITARAESRSDRVPLMHLVPGLILLFVPVAVVGISSFRSQLPLFFFNAPILGFIIIGWACYQARVTRQIGTFVSRLLAAIPLVDFLIVANFAIIAYLLPPNSTDAQSWILYILPLLLFILAKLLQKISPAT